MPDLSEQTHEDEMTHEQFAKELTRFAQACSRGDSGQALAARSALLLHDKAQSAKLARGVLVRARLSALEAENVQLRERGCEFGCGRGGDEYVTPGVGIVPACPVHGWVVPIIDNALARARALEAEREKLAALLEELDGGDRAALASAGAPDDGAARMACGCDSGTHDNSLTQIARYHKGNPWPIRDALRGSAKETSE